jgi:hypothetical protein
MAESNFIPFLGLSDGNALDYFTADDAIWSPSDPPNLAYPLRRDPGFPLPLVGFPRAVGDETSPGIFLQGSMGQDYNGGLISTDIYWMADTAESGDCVWVVAWLRFNAGQAMDDPGVAPFPSVKFVASPAPATAGKIQKATIVFTQVEAASVGPGDPYALILARNFTSIGPDDTMDGDAQFLRLNLEGI